LASPDISGKLTVNQPVGQGGIVNLAKYLREIRTVQGKSLRAVEEATGISNAYLSQLERGEATKPSPDKLQALAKFYAVSYTDLMRAAGYLKPGAATPLMAAASASPPDRLSALQAALMSAPLTPEEEDAVVKYIQFLRFQNKK
jgi:transcriptional regulator with XRE-family HTH domain